MVNTKAECFLKDSEFLKKLGQLQPKSEERYEYLKNHKAEQEEIRKNIIYIKYPYLDFEYMQSVYGDEASNQILNESNAADDLDYELLSKHIEGAFRNWHRMEENTKSFRNYVLDYYDLARKSKEIKENSWQATSGYVNRLVRCVNNLLKKHDTVAAAIEELAESGKYGNVDEKTWKKVEEACTTESFALSLDYNPEEGGESLANCLNGEELDVNTGLLEAIEAAKEDASLYCEKAITNIRHSENIKTRERLCCAYSSMILKTLKYENNTKISDEPAVSSVGYEVWEREKVKLVQFVFEKGYVEFLIQNTPKSLNEFDGICWNLMHDNREIDNKNLLKYLNQKRAERGEKNISESALSQWLTKHNVSFSGYNTAK